MTAYVVDTETTGHFEEQEQPQIIELAYGKADDDLLAAEVKVERFQPSIKITPGALAVHHIIPEDLAGCPPHTEAKLPADCEYIIGHNVDHDWKALGSPPVKRICTLAFARYFWPQEKGHSLGACFYRVAGSYTRAREVLRYAHSAAVDVRVCWELMKYFRKEYLFAVASWHELWQLCENARMPRYWAFGKHRGKKIGHEFGDGRPDTGYHRWCSTQLEMDPWVKKALAAYKEGLL